MGSRESLRCTEEESKSAEYQGDSTTYEPYVQYLNLLAVNWSSWAAAIMLTTDIILYLKPRFNYCSSSVKIRILTSLLYLKSDFLRENREILSDLLVNAESDVDEWVKKLSRLLQPYVATGTMDLKETDTETAYKVIKFVDEQKQIHKLNIRIKPPLEGPHMCDPMSPEDFPRPPVDDGTNTPSIFKLPSYRTDTANFRSPLDLSTILNDVDKMGLRQMENTKRKLESDRGHQAKLE
eukprot:Lankesteria_metandrocarpae@DN971_c0_g1_i1.p1